jgi:SAM-dependent methyltransferase
MEFGERSDEGAARIRAFVQAIAGLVRPGDLDGLRVLDLGAGDGAVAGELALRGASVLAIEGREANAAAIRSLRDGAGIEPGRLVVRVADVRRLDWDALGEFEVIVCSGLLYHLELDAAVALTASLARACTRLALIDTEVAWGPVERRGRFAGHAFREHAPGAAAADRAAARLASLDNDESFWLTRASLHALLHDAGFASSWELGSPGQPRREARATVAALVGESVERLALEPARTLPPPRPAEPRTGRMQAARIGLARLRARGDR